MAYLNKWFGIGNLTRDPELRVTPKGTSICQFGLACTRKYKSEDGNAGEETAFIDIEAWGKQGELVAKHLTKGSPAMVEGRLKLDQWEDKQSGQKRSKLKVVLENVQFLGSGKRDEQGQPQRQADTETRRGMKDEAPKTPSQQDDGEDVPF